MLVMLIGMTAFDHFENSPLMAVLHETGLPYKNEDLKKKQRQTKEIGKHNHSMLWSCLVQTFIADFLFFGFSFGMSPSEDPGLSTSIPLSRAVTALL